MVGKGVPACHGRGGCGARGGGATEREGHTIKTFHTPDDLPGPLARSLTSWSGRRGLTDDPANDPHDAMLCRVASHQIDKSTAIAALAWDDATRGKTVLIA
jgi:hypothetical protein